MDTNIQHLLRRRTTPIGDNQSRVGFTYHHVFHPRGKYFQEIIKPLIIKAIESGHYLIAHDLISPEFMLTAIARPLKTVHKSILNRYDEDAYKHDDTRLQALESDLKGFFTQNQHNYHAKAVDRAIDIFIFLLKEDIYYRARIFYMINSIPDDINVTDIIKFLKSIIPTTFTSETHDAAYKRDFMLKIMDILDVVVQKDPRLLKVIRGLPRYTLTPEEIAYMEKYH